MVNACLGHFGVRLVSTHASQWQPTLASGLARLAHSGLATPTIIDVGASNGSWSRQALAALPTAKQALLIEAQSVHAPALEEFLRDHPQSHVVHAVAGPQVGEASFNANSAWDGAASRGPQRGGSWTQLPQTSIDHEIAARHLPGPYLIKLDTHGFERAVLEGATATLRDTSALIIECYNVELGGEAMRFPTFCQHMETLGYRCADLWDPLYLGDRPKLWQFDLLFLRTDAMAALDPRTSR